MPEQPRELYWDIDGLRYAGLAWGDPANPPLLALHGWLDNAAGFARLAPLLDQYHVVAVDLSGHGRSSWRSADATYQIYDDLPQLCSLLDQLGWSRCHLMGHSRGAIIATLLAATFPERVDRLVLLDGMAPAATAEAEFITQMGDFVRQRKRFLGRRVVVYPSLEKALEARVANGLPQQAAETMLPRGLLAVDGGYSWSFDPRLRGASAMKLSEAQVDAMLAAVRAPTLLLVAQEGFVPRLSSRLPQQLARLANGRMETLPGGHHFHLEDGVATLAASIRQFLNAD